MKKFRFLIFIALIFLILYNMTPLIKKSVYPLRYQEYIYEYSKEYKLDEFLVMALIKAESNYIFDAHSGVARGLMQITDDTALWISEKLSMDFSPDDIENPKTNINMGCYYLRYLLDYYKENEALALAAYNAGMGNVDKWLKNKEYSKNGMTLDKIPFKETEQYIEKLGKYKEIYKNLYKIEEE